MAPRRGKKAAATAVVEIAVETVQSDAKQDNGKPVKVAAKKIKAPKIAKPTEQNHEELNEEEIAPVESKKAPPKRTAKQPKPIETNDENTAPANAKAKPTKQTAAAKKNAKKSEESDADTNDEAIETVNGAEDDDEKPSGKGRKKKADAPKVVETTASKGKSKKAEPQPTNKVEKKAVKAKPAKKEEAIVVVAKAPETKIKRGAAKKAESPKKPVESERSTSRRGRKAADKANLAMQEESNTADDDETADENNTVDSPKKPKGKGKKVAERAKASKTKPKDNDTADEDNATVDEPNIEVASPKGRKRKPANAIKSPAKKAKVENVDVIDGGSGSKGKGSPKKRKADGKGPADSTTNDNDTADELVTKRKKPSKAEAKEKPEKSKLNPIDTDYSDINFDTDKVFNMKIVSWNVSGLRSLVTKDGFEYFGYEKPDIICLQEIKCLEEEVPAQAKLKGYHPYWCSTPGGRGGVAVLSKQMPYNVEKNIGNEEMDEEGRLITLEYSKFFLVCVYVPNAGRKLVNLDRRLRWNQLFEDHVSKLKAKKPVIIVGDMNVAHEEIDLANPKTNRKNAGFSDEERSGMTELLKHGFVDTFRDIYPSKEKAYSFWTYMGNARQKNTGWRLDYSLVSENLKSKVVDSFMRPQVLGSDHCPIVLLMNF